MLDFCGEHNITADVEVIPIQKVNEAIRMAGQVGSEIPFFYRYGFSKVGIKWKAMSVAVVGTE